MVEPTFPDRIEKLLEEEKYQEVAEYAKPLAEAGDAEAQFLLGYLYFTSADAEWPESKKWLRNAAEQDHADALYYLAGIQADEPDEEISICFCCPPDTMERCQMLRRAAELGSLQAQRDLGCYLCLGETGESGFEKDEGEGRKWYLKAAQGGHPDAQYEVGLMFLLGEGGNVDVEEGLRWLEKSASSNDHDPSSESAADVLAAIYENGHHGVPIDMEKAESMKKRAAELDKALIKKYGSQQSDRADDLRSS